MTENGLYKLEKITDNPKYEGFGFVREKSLRGGSYFESDFGPQGPVRAGRECVVPPLAPLWKPQPVVGRVRPFNDYPCVNLIIPAFSRRAVDVLRDFLEPNGELLPLVSEVGEYFAYNITTIVNILDHKRSEISWYEDDPDLASTVTRYVCLPDKMAGLSIFSIPEASTSTFVTQAFVDRVRLHRLQGFRFIKLWPLPAGVNYQEEDRAETEGNLTVDTPRGRVPIKGNTVVIRLGTAKAKANKAEKDRLATFMDELDGLLYEPRPEAPYFGSLEGDDRVDGELRLFLSCPDANVLLDRLRPWLKTLSWNGRVSVMKRFGEMTDLNCREETLDLQE